VKRWWPIVVIVIVLVLVGGSAAVYVDWTWKRKLSFKFYGIDVDPQQLNWFLTATGGFTEQGWLYWDRAAWIAPDRVRHVYEDLPSYQLIDSNIAHGNPVIVRVRLGSGITHFVVIAGKDGFDYLVRDPGAGSAKGLYPLRELGSDIEALRFYQPITAANSQLSARR